MFLEFYGLKEQPFGVTPDPRFICPSRTHSKALNSLSRGLEAGCGFLALIAKPGMGKTTLVFQLLKQINQTSRPIFLFHTQCDSREFLRYLLRCLGIDAARLDVVGMYERLNQFLGQELRAGRRLVVIIDECQNLDSSVLETIRLLSDFETPKTKLMQIVLVGQAQLAEKLSSPSLAQLRQRISILCRLEPLTREEIIRYIEHRLQVAGYAGAPLFTNGALEWILALSEGIPRNINNLCFNSLLAGCAAGRKQIDFDVVDQVLNDLEIYPLEGMGTRQETSSVTEAPIGYPGFDLSAIYPGTVTTNPGRRDFTSAGKIVTEFETTLSSPVPQIPQAQGSPPHRKGHASPAHAAPDDFLGSKVNSRNEHERASDFGTNSPSRKLNVAQPLGQPREAQTYSNAARGDFSRRNQANISYPARSIGGRFGPRVAGSLTLGAAFLLTGFLVFHSKVGASRQTEDPLGTPVAPVVSPPPSPPVSSPLAAGSTPADSLPATDVASAQSFQTRILERKIVRILIDPGHGGHDTGTTGPTGLTEKELCLDVALRLGRIIKQRLPNADVIFTRTKDMFISLEERTYIANDIKADLFLSIHANSSPSPAVRGIETYYLNFAGSAEVMEVAARENAMAQEKVSHRFELMKKIGLGEKKMEESRMFAEDIQDSLSRLIQPSASSAQNRHVGRAPFVVLARTNMPSVLTEIAFLSNPSDEQLLRQAEYRERLAEGLYQGVATYLQSQNTLTHNPPARPDVPPSAFSPVSVESQVNGQARSQP